MDDTTSSSCAGRLQSRDGRRNNSRKSGRWIPTAGGFFEESFLISKREYAKKVFGTEDEAHPGVAKIYSMSSKVVSGRIRAVSKFPLNSVFERFTLTPKETRILFQEKGWKDIIAFQTRNAPHIGHEY